MHEHGGCIYKSHRQYNLFVEIISYKECSLGNILINMALPVSIMKANRCKVLCAPHLVQKILVLWYWVWIFYCGLVSAQYSIQKYKESSIFFANTTGAPHSEKKGLMAPNSNRPSIYYFTNNSPLGLWWYSPFCTDSVPGSSGIECMSHSFLSGGILFGNYPGKTLRYFQSKSHSGPQCS